METLPRFARLVARHLGLHFPKERLPELAQKMASLVQEAGFDDLDGYLAWLMSAPLSQEQMKILGSALTIGETYFLRDPKSYRVLEEQLLPELIAARRHAGKTLTIWSAGCSSGEEPYSIAIILSRALPDLADWKIELLATDINPLALERARRGVYSKWSFRNAPGWLMDYFTKEADGSYSIVPRIREMVSFSHLNLADPRGSSRSSTSGTDIIFCRNVMLYFHSAQIEKTIARFHAALKNGGWLFVGPTEVDHQKLPGFSCHHYDGALVLRKTELRSKVQRQSPPARESQAMKPAPAPQASVPAVPVPAVPVPAAPEPTTAMPAADGEAAPLEEAELLYRAGDYERAALLALDSAGKEEPEALALAARCYANIGRYSEARGYCEQAIARDRLNAHNHYLLSMILEQQGDAEAAVRSLKHALYIDHDYLLAYFALGNLSRQRGEQREAELSFANALRLLQRRDPGEALPEAEGMTAGSLAQLIREMSTALSQG